MSLSFKLSFDLSDFEDDKFLHDLIKFTYKLFKEKVIKQSATLEEVLKQLKIIIFKLLI